MIFDYYIKNNQDRAKKEQIDLIIISALSLAIKTDIDSSDMQMTQYMLNQIWN